MRYQPSCAIAKGIHFIHDMSVFHIERESTVAAALGEDDTGCPRWRCFHIRSKREAEPGNVRKNRIRQTLHSIAKYEQFSVSSGQRLFARWLKNGIDVVALRFLVKELLQFFQLFRMIGRQIMGLAVVVADVIELPRLFICAAGRSWFPGRPCAASRPPAIFVNSKIADRSKVLNVMIAGFVGMIEGIQQA